MFRFGRSIRAALNSVHALVLASDDMNLPRQAIAAIICGVFSGLIVLLGMFLIGHNTGGVVELILLAALITGVPATVAVITHVYLIDHLARKRPETRCRKCGYILRGITEPRCPECGERI